jgi:hypothetical protein
MIALIAKLLSTISLAICGKDLLGIMLTLVGFLTPLLEAMGI